MRGARLNVAVCVLGILVVAVMPLSAAIAPSDSRQARFVGAALTVAAATACGLLKTERRGLWSAIAAASAVAAVILLFEHLHAGAVCVATYNGRAVLIGREYTAAAADYVTKHPGLSASDLLLDAGGVPERIWTSSSISSCWFLAGWGGLLAVPLLFTALCALMARRGYRVRAAPTGETRPAAGPGQPAVYDAFISYRHADRGAAEQILEALEAKRLRVAIDFRDFAPNEHFLSEMERCVKTSRFVLCVITTGYLESGHTAEEALISKTLDMADRQMRLVPLIFEAVELPVWLHGLVGIDFTATARVDPIERLVELVVAKGDIRSAV